MLEADWLGAQPSFSSFSWTFGILGAEAHLLKAASKGQAQGQKMLPILGGEMQLARGQRPNLHDSRRGDG